MSDVPSLQEHGGGATHVVRVRRGRPNRVGVVRWDVWHLVGLGAHIRVTVDAHDSFKARRIARDAINMLLERMDRPLLRTTDGLAAVPAGSWSPPYEVLETLAGVSRSARPEGVSMDAKQEECSP